MYKRQPLPPLRREVALPPECDLDRDRTRSAALASGEGHPGLDTVVEPTVKVWVWESDRDWDRDLERCRDLDRLCSACGRLVLLDGRRPYLLPLVSVCCGCLTDARRAEESVEVAGVLVVVSESACPGDPGGVELVTGANTSSLLTFTSHCPVALYLVASSANTT